MDCVIRCINDLDQIQIRTIKKIRNIKYSKPTFIDYKKKSHRRKIIETILGFATVIIVGSCIAILMLSY